MHSDAMNQTKIISPRLTKVLGEEAGFTDEEIELYLTFLRIKTIEKKEHLLVPGDTCNDVSFINKGCMSRYIIDEHSEETILNFALEDHFVGDLESFIYQKPTIYYIQALEKCELLQLSRDNFYRVTEELPKFKKFHDDRMQRNHYYTLKRLSIAKSATPEEKYISLMKEKPQLFQRVPLHYIASYLGIKPESLSRLRKRIVVKPHSS
jgi:CRP-like cAMP-binding protein